MKSVCFAVLFSLCLGLGSQAASAGKNTNRMTHPKVTQDLGRAPHPQHGHHLPAPREDLPSTHGMIVLGGFGDNLILYHLPMFHRPHDFQVAIEVSLDPVSATRFKTELEDMKGKTGKTTALYTLVPERFSLTQMISNPKPFKAQLVRGHFERGGTVLLDQVSVQVKRILFSKALGITSAKSSTYKGLLFAVNDEFFMAHEILGGPNYDQLTKVELSSSPLKEILKKDGFARVQMPSMRDQVPLAVGQSVIAESSVGGGLALLIEPLEEIYLDSADLQN